MAANDARTIVGATSSVAGVPCRMAGSNALRFKIGIMLKNQRRYVALVEAPRAEWDPRTDGEHISCSRRRHNCVAISSICV
jgi:hypothetical protein